jgi:hypothetical protein
MIIQAIIQTIHEIVGIGLCNGGHSFRPIAFHLVTRNDRVSFL